MREPTLAEMNAIDRVLLGLLLAAAASGLTLRAFGTGALLPSMVVIHLGSVAALLAILPAGKFVHAPLRLMALAQNAEERRRSF